MAGSVVVEAEDGRARSRSTFAILLASLVDVVAEVDDIVVLVLPGSIAIRVEVAVGWDARSDHLKTRIQGVP